MEITVVNDSSVVGWLASATRVGEIYMSNVKDMVNNVLIAAGTNQISRLNILDHGNSGGIYIGTDYVTDKNVGSFRATLVLLRGHFTENGFVHLQHCEIGNNQALLRTLAQIWGVPVYGGTGSHNPIYRFNFGDYVRCRPDGVCQTNVSRP